MFKRKQTVISDSEPFVVGNLSVYPSSIMFKGKSYDLSEVKHIRWYWLQKTINGFPTHTTELGLSFYNDDKKISLRNNVPFTYKKFVKAYQYIAKETFEHRLSSYAQQLEQSGSFSYNHCEVHSDGRVVSKGKVYKLSNASFEPFEMVVKEGGLLSSKLKMSLMIDRDVILPLLKYINKNPQHTSVYGKIGQALDL